MIDFQHFDRSQMNKSETESSADALRYFLLDALIFIDFNIKPITMITN